MHIGDIDFYKEFLYDRAGLQIQSDQSFILDSRLTPVARKWSYPNLKAMTMALRGVPDPHMIDDVLDAIVPSQTEFFRDPELFTLIERRALPFLAKRGPLRKMRFWSAGCATGEEAWSLAMTVLRAQHEHKLKLRTVDILATDINHGHLDKAARALYTQHAVQALPVTVLTHYFRQQGDDWQIVPDAVNMLTFQHFNLLHDMQNLGAFDLILCRNVLSGFDDTTRLRVLNDIAERLAPHGLLALGAGEALPNGMQTLKPVENCPYFLSRVDGPKRI